MCYLLYGLGSRSVQIIPDFLMRVTHFGPPFSPLGNDAMLRYIG
jgi:hypothetical protein